MSIEKYFELRSQVLEESRSDDGSIKQSSILDQVLPYISDSNLIESEECSHSYYVSESNKSNTKINGFVINSTTERLNLFIVNEKSISEILNNNDLHVTTRSYYEEHFVRAKRFAIKAFKGDLYNQSQDSEFVTRALASKLSSDEGIEQIDVVEIFLISLTATVYSRSSEIVNRSMNFIDDKIKVLSKSNKERKTKEIDIKYTLVDLNFMYDEILSKGMRAPLIVDFNKIIDQKIEVIQAANESNFASYLCVLPGELLENLYKNYSSRLLEKNVRSFLEFRGVNKGIKNTIKESPEKFIAYNNGLTITASKVMITTHKKKNYIDKLTDFQIVNGGQTTATIYFASKEGLDISNIKVMAKINIIKEVKEEILEEFISKISEFSNSQSKVSKVDLRSRNPKLQKLKLLSKTIMTPSRKLWFFERARGEFITIIKKANLTKSQAKEKFPTKRRFSKEQLAKYYTAWGVKPFIVKKGGEKVFRYFIEQLDGSDEVLFPITINDEFYKNLISKIILFKEMEIIHGVGKNGISQIRSAVIPYSISIIYKYTDGDKKHFNLSKIWDDEDLKDTFKIFLRELMILMSILIKQYSFSDDYGEYSKKSELWESINNCPEINNFINMTNNQKALSDYYYLDGLEILQE